MSIFHKNRAAKEKGIKEKTGLHARSRRKYMNECALALQLVQLPQQDTGDIFTGRLDLNGADVLGHHGHPVHHAGLLILPDGEGPGLPHLQKPIRAVPAHAGHDDAHHLAPAPPWRRTGRPPTAGAR